VSKCVCVRARVNLLQVILARLCVCVGVCARKFVSFCSSLILFISILHVACDMRCVTCVYKYEMCTSTLSPSSLMRPTYMCMRVYIHVMYTYMTDDICNMCMHIHMQYVYAYTYAICICIYPCTHMQYVYAYIHVHIYIYTRMWDVYLNLCRP
jgi:hypothetical protein